MRMNVKLKSLLKIVAVTLVVVGASVAPVQTTFAAAPDPGKPVIDCTGDGTADPGCTIVTKYLNPFIKLLSVLAGVSVVVGIIIGGIRYSMSGGDPQKTAQAKTIIRNSIVALLVFFFLFALLKFLIPGKNLLVG